MEAGAGTTTTSHRSSCPYVLIFAMNQSSGSLHQPLRTRGEVRRTSSRLTIREARRSQSSLRSCTRTVVPTWRWQSGLLAESSCFGGHLTKATREVNKTHTKRRRQASSRLTLLKGRRTLSCDLGPSEKDGQQLAFQQNKHRRRQHEQRRGSSPRGSVLFCQQSESWCRSCIASNHTTMRR